MVIEAAGALTTVQDLGRKGYANRGIQENGACDKFSSRVANQLVGNRKDAAVLEMTLKGDCIRFTSEAVIALTGADMQPTVNGSRIPMYRPVAVQPGAVLNAGTAVFGLRMYLAVRGGINVPAVLGSRSTGLKCRMGGYEGRALRRGDILNIGQEDGGVMAQSDGNGGTGSDEAGSDGAAVRCSGREDRLRTLLPACGVRVADGKQYPQLRVVPGPQQEAFTEKGLQTFVGAVYHLSAQSDRMGCKLEGAAIETFHGSDIVSDGIVEGSIQVSSDGQPIVMLADHQTTGGYAKIGTLIRADVPRIAQMRPGDPVAFCFVTAEEAVLAARAMERQLSL